MKVRGIRITTAILPCVTFLLGLGLGTMHNTTSLFLMNFSNEINDAPDVAMMLTSTESNHSITTVTESNHSITSTSLKPNSTRECVHVLFTLSGNKSGFLSEFSVSLKSVLLNSPLDKDMTIHILSDELAHQAISHILYNETKLGQWTTRNQISIKTYNIQRKIKPWTSYLKNATGCVLSNKHTFGTFLRLFAHQVLPNDVDFLIYLDTDIAIMANLEEVWRYRNSSSIFQWGNLKCAGFLLLNLQRFGNEFWDRVREIDKIHNLKHLLKTQYGTQIVNDQTILQSVAKIYPHLTSPLPEAWDIHVATNAYRWRTEAKILENRPQAGYAHLNGGGGSQLSAFENSIFVTGKSYKKTWSVVQYYATYPWLWTKFHLASQLKDGQGYLVAIDYTP